MCSFAQKAEFASRNIHPKGVVKILIIDGEIRINDADDEGYAFGSEIEDDKGGEDDLGENNHLSSFEFPSYYNTDDEKKTTLRREHEDDISVALLHVSYRTGYELIETILDEDIDVRNAGGTRVTVDAVSPPLTGAVIIVWTAVSIVICLILCCCMAAALEDLLENQEPEPAPLRRPRRQRLTTDQVRELHVGIFDGNKLVYDEENPTANGVGEYCCDHILQHSNDKNFPQPTINSMDTCTICLDDYQIGDKLCCLPCGHVFHAECISKWLVERSATCPLCNLDLYEEEVDDNSEGEEDEYTNNERQARNGSAPTTQVEPDMNEDASTIDHSIGSWLRAIFRSPYWRNRTTGGSSGLEALAEPLLQQDQPEHPTSAGIDVEATPSNEESSTGPTEID
ncbi:unnamed protein product [Pseudo-nitzschia multistriata]|uniref:RING-type E3 ubiquitin transferase n=1 Tax=Pseudo-nitzschia multistriata TaxID=183589 RepID=A0A448Z0Q8_9STRA|nr:unnamed protein product [Pseudo-nitzschia multistriata]